MQYLTREDLLDLHTYVVIRYGGLLGIASQDKLNMVLHAPRQELFGTQLYWDVCSKAAALMYFIIKNHPFVSGNNTTALLAMLRFLKINGLYLHQHIDDAALSGLIRALNRSEMNREDLESWLRDNALYIQTE